jgi:hypothetical protein
MASPVVDEGETFRPIETCPVVQPSEDRGVDEGETLSAH